MPYHIQTSRLTLRPLVKEDFSFMRAIYTNEDVLKHIGALVARTEEQTRAALENTLKTEKEDPRLGSWIVELKLNSTPIGMSIIRPPATKAKTEGLEIGYSFLPAYWGKGYAQEAAQGMVKYAYQEFGSVRMIALIAPINGASRNVLLKTGFTSIGMTEYVDPSNGEIKSTEILEIPKASST